MADPAAVFHASVVAEEMFAAPFAGETIAGAAATESKAALVVALPMLLLATHVYEV